MREFQKQTSNFRSQTRFTTYTFCSSIGRTCIISYILLFQTTAVLSYKPSEPSKILSCNLQSLEVFSCSLQAEEETALSIVDRTSVSIDLNANPLPVLQQTSTAGLMDTLALESKQLLLEVSYICTMQ